MSLCILEQIKILADANQKFFGVSCVSYWICVTMSPFTNSKFKENNTVILIDKSMQHQK